MQRTITRIILTGLITSSISVHAEIYKWVDEHGRTHYGEKPPAANAAAEIKVEETPQATSADVKTPEQINEERDRLLKVLEEERNQKKEEKLKQEEELVARKQKCTQLENDLKDVKQGGTVYYDLDKDGERQYISEEDLAERIEAMEKKYKQEC